MDPKAKKKIVIIVDYISPFIGKGFFGRVLKGRFGDTPAAIKVVDLMSYPDREDLPLKRDLRHDNIVHYFGMGTVDGLTYFAMELCAGNLEQLIKGQYNGPTPGTMEQMMLQVTLGLQYLHIQSIVHRDLKPENILISKPINESTPPKMKLADFGLSKELSYERIAVLSKNGIGTVGWVAPELLASHQEELSDIKYTIDSDIFSLGCLFGYCFTGGCHPFGSNRIYQAANIHDGKLDWNDEHKIKDEPLKTLIKCMVDKETGKRPKLDQILEHPPFKQLLPENKQNAVGAAVSRKPQSEYIYEVRKIIGNQDMKMQDDKIEVDYDEFLGVGTFGSVYRGRFKGTDAAIKLIQRDDEREISFLHLLSLSLKHENILRYYGHRVDENLSYHAMELCEGTLDDWIKGKYNVSSPGVMAQTMLQVTLGLQYLHSQHIIHRNLKPRNILLLSLPDETTSTPPKIKLALSWSFKKLDPEFTAVVVSISGCVGTIGWMAPESFPQEDSEGESLTQSYSSDIFSLGCVFGYCFTGGIHPFGIFHNTRAINMRKGWLSKEFEDKCDSQNGFAPNLKALIIDMIHKDPNKRPKIQDILNHPAFATVLHKK